MLVSEHCKVYYADQAMEVQKQALSFPNQQFFHQFGNLNQHAVFQPNGTYLFELSDEQVAKVNDIYGRMLEEMNSHYVHKYDVLRNLVFELLRFAMKLQPSVFLSCL